MQIFTPEDQKATVSYTGYVSDRKDYSGLVIAGLAALILMRYSSDISSLFVAGSGAFDRLKNLKGAK